LATYEDPVLQGASGPGGEIYKTQLQLLINIIENFIAVQNNLKISTCC